MSLLSQFFPSGGKGDPQSDVVPLEILAVGGGGGGGALYDMCADLFFYNPISPSVCPGGSLQAGPSCIPIQNGHPATNGVPSAILACGTPNSCYPGQYRAGAGGGGGVYYADYFASPGITYPITVGAGGAGGNGPGVRGFTGGTSSFNTPTGTQLIYAIGGGGGGSPSSVHQTGSCESACVCADGVSGASAGGSIGSRPYGSYCSTGYTTGWCFCTNTRQASGSIYGTTLALYDGASSRSYSTLQSTRYGYNAGGPSRGGTVGQFATYFSCGGSAGNALCGSTPYYLNAMTGTTQCFGEGGTMVGYQCCNPTFNTPACGCINGVCANTGRGGMGIEFAFMPSANQHTCRGNGWSGSPGTVIIRYPTAFPAAPSFPGGTDCSPQTPGFRTYRFNSSGSITLP